LATGAFLALLVKGGIELRQLVTPARLIVALWALVLIARLWVFPGFAWDNYFVHSGIYSGWAAAFGGLLILAVGSQQTSFLPTIFTNSILRIIGKYSYALYVFHWFIGKALLAVLDSLETRYPVIGNLPRPVIQVVYIATAGIFSFVAAWASWHLYEKHFLKLKRFFEYRQTPMANPVQSPATVPVTPTASTS
jgi:peptidoglycan/LPS O-acetylase OafA/YrhL